MSDSIAENAHGEGHIRELHPQRFELERHIVGVVQGDHRRVEEVQAVVVNRAAEVLVQRAVQVCGVLRNQGRWLAGGKRRVVVIVPREQAEDHLDFRDGG